MKDPFKSSPLKPLNQITLNLAGMVLGWVPFKIVSDSPALHSRWLLLLKIEISSIVHCCFSINQNELKFELHLHGNGRDGPWVGVQVSTYKPKYQV